MKTTHIPMAGRALALLLVTLTAPAWATEPLPILSGGITGEERAGMESLSADYSLQLTCVTEDGGYLADVAITVRHGTQGEVLLETRSDGPLLYVALPPGDYTVSAQRGEVSQKQTVKIGTEAPAKLMFRFPQE